LSRATV